MIFPWFQGIKSIMKTPVVWILLLLNISVYVNFYYDQSLGNQELEKFYESEFLVIQGNLFAEFIDQNLGSYDDLYQKLSTKVLSGDRKKASILGQLAVRDNFFRKEGPSFPFTGDEVAIDYWKKNFRKFIDAQNIHPNYKWGFSSRNNDYIHWISYQFMHSDIFHLFVNMVYLMFVGTTVELILGSMSFLLFYLSAGAAAALFYLMLVGLNPVPLVGASGSISGLLGIVTVVLWKQRQKFFYFVLPIQPYFGWIYLPIWVIFISSILSDLAGYFGKLSVLGGVAYTAHIGGLMFGLFFGFLFRWSKTLSKGIFNHNNRVHELQ